ncbi:MAG: flippase-like domain-containing protein [Desulfobacterota bacterium]|nr:flippase-like domain-containing protein [Thermodesulfobacteriota bacterium]
MSVESLPLKRLFLSLLFTSALLLILFTQISLKDLYHLLIRIDPFWGIIAAVSYLFALYLRALRFRWLIHSSEVLLSELFRITVLYHLSLMVLPSKLGELTYPYLLNRWSGLGMTEGLASLITSRVYDFFLIGILAMFILLGFQGGFQADLLTTSLLSIAFILFTLFAFYNISHWLRWAVHLVDKISQQAGWEKRRTVVWIKRKMYELAEDFYAIRAKKTFYPVSLASLGAWIAIFLVFYALMRGFGIEVSVFECLFGSTVAVIANALPLSGLGNWGTLEAGWAAGFLVVGLPKEEAIASGFGVHLVIFVVCGLTALVCWISYHRPR